MVHKVIGGLLVFAKRRLSAWRYEFSIKANIPGTVDVCAVVNQATWQKSFRQECANTLGFALGRFMLELLSCGAAPARQASALQNQAVVLITIGQTATTPSPTSSTPAPTATVLTGDPFTTFNGKKVQFWIPAGQETKLLTCGDYELMGRVMGSGIKDDTQQWFDMFRLQVAGKEAVALGTRDVATLLPPGAGAGAEVAAEDDVSVLPVELQQLSVEEQARRASAMTAGQALTTLRLAVDGADVPSTGLFNAAARMINITVTRDAAHRIGRGYTEVLDINTAGLGMQIHSALAGKLVGDERVKKMHLDLAFTALNITGCTGVLPEVWGLRPMSQHTARFLNPQQP